MAVSSVSLVVVLLDDFTGKAITDASFSFSINGRNCLPVEKPRDEGIYVFINLPEENYTVTVTGYKYCRATVKLQRSVLPQKLRLYRNGAYFTDCSYIKESGEPNEIIRRVCCDETALKVREIKMQEDASVIQLSGYGIGNLTGLSFLIKEGGNEEYFIMEERITAAGYSTSPRLKNTYGEKAMLQRCFTGICDKNGDCYIAVGKNFNGG